MYVKMYLSRLANKLTYKNIYAHDNDNSSSYDNNNINKKSSIKNFFLSGC